MANLLITKENLDLDNSFKVEDNKVKLHENVTAEVAKSIDITAKLEPVTQKIEEVNSTLRVSVANVKNEVNTINATVLATKRDLDTLNVTVQANKAKVDNLSELETQKDQLIALSPKVQQLEEKVTAVESVTVTTRELSTNLNKLANFTVSQVTDINATLSYAVEELHESVNVLHDVLDHTVELQDLNGQSLGYLLDKATVDKLVSWNGYDEVTGTVFTNHKSNNHYSLYSDESSKPTATGVGEQPNFEEKLKETQPKDFFNEDEDEDEE